MDVISNDATCETPQPFQKRDVVRLNKHPDNILLPGQSSRGAPQTNIMALRRAMREPEIR